MDGDGDSDIVASYFSFHEVRWIENDGGDGLTWIEHIPEEWISGPSELTIVDVDFDDDLDIIGIDYGGDNVFLLENASGDASSWSYEVFEEDFGEPRSLVAADLDGDADLDVASVCSWDDQIAWWANPCY
jgi:hypothetical protein